MLHNKSGNISVFNENNLNMIECVNKRKEPELQTPAVVLLAQQTGIYFSIHFKNFFSFRIPSHNAFHTS